MQQRFKNFLVVNKHDLLQAGCALVILALFFSLLTKHRPLTSKNKSVLGYVANVAAVLGTVSLSGSSVGVLLSYGRRGD